MYSTTQQSALSVLHIAFKGYDPETEYVGVTPKKGRLSCAGDTVLPHIHTPDWFFLHARSPFYFCTSTVKEGDINRKLPNLANHRVLLIDDVVRWGPDDFGETRQSPLLPPLPEWGPRPEKTYLCPPVTPHFRIRTSPIGPSYKEQWLYLMEAEPVTDELQAKMNAFARALGKAGMGDPGASGCHRIARLPGSLHLKTGFRAQVILSRPDLPLWTVDKLAKALGLEIGKKRKKQKDVPPESIHDVVDWLLSLPGSFFDKQNGPEGGIAFVCTRYHQNPPHYDKSPQGRYWLDTGVFQCFHGTCCEGGQRGWAKWVKEQGGPDIVAVNLPEGVRQAAQNWLDEEGE